MFKNFLKQFREFAVKGNVVDMAVGIIIGAAFTSIVNSLVKDIIMPPISLLLSRVNFSNLFVVLKNGPNIPGPYDSLDAALQAGAVTMNIGTFVNNVISFLIVATAVFMLVKIINRMKHEPLPPPPNTKECPFCKTPVHKAAVKCPACTADIK